MKFTTNTLPTKSFNALTQVFFSNIKNDAGIPLSIAAGIRSAYFYPAGTPRALSKRAAREAEAAAALDITPRDVFIAATNSADEKGSLVVEVSITPSIDNTASELSSVVTTEGFSTTVNAYLARSINGELTDTEAYTLFVPGTCSDGVKDGEETDVDCGGGECYACTLKETCKVRIISFIRTYLNRSMNINKRVANSLMPAHIDVICQ